MDAELTGISAPGLAALLQISEAAAASLMLDKRWVTPTIMAAVCDQYGLMLTKKPGVLTTKDAVPALVRAVWLGSTASFTVPNVKRHREDAFQTHFGGEATAVFIFTAEHLWVVPSAQIAAWSSQGFIVEGKIKRSRLLGLLAELQRPV